MENKDNNSKRVFFVEKDLEDMENYKKGKVKKVIKGLKKASNSHKKQAQTLTKVIKSYWH